MNIPKTLDRLVQKVNLSSTEAEELMNAIMTGAVSPVETAAVLTALRAKGESSEEILGFIYGMRKHMQTIRTGGVVIDTCGTGGDGANTFNISTGVAIVAASCGVKVAKHGNRAVSSKSGSADVLDALGVNIALKPADAAHLLSQTGIVFLFAPIYHPSMRHAAPVRKTLGIRTIFNILGPFANPAGVKRQIIGVPNRSIAERLADVGRRLQYDNLLLVTGLGGIDELSISGDSTIYEIKGTSMKKRTVHPNDFGIEPKDQGSIRGGTPAENAAILRLILQGEKGARRDIVCLNAGAALYVAGVCPSIKEGLTLAEDAIDTGKANALLDRFITTSQFYAHYPV